MAKGKYHCKGPGAGMCLQCWRTSKQLELKRGRGSGGSEVGADITGPWIMQAAERTLAFILSEIKIIIVLSKEIT